MDTALLKNIVRELDEILSGGIISKIHQPDEKTLLFKVFSRGKEKALLISTHPKFSRIHLTKEKFENPPRPKRFCAYLRSRIENARIEGIKQLDNQRIVNMELKKHKEENPYMLAVELTGKSSNVILLDSNGIVLDCLRWFPEETSLRTVIPGIKLKTLPLPEVMREIPLTIAPLKDKTWNEAVESYYSGIIEQDRFEEIKRKLRHAIKAARKKAQRKLENLLNDKKESEENIEKRTYGDLLLANFKKLKHGMSEADVEDFYSTPPKTVKIPLDKKLSPQENADRYFKRAKKAKTAIMLLSKRIPEVEKEIEYADGLMYELENIKDIGDAELLRDELIEAGYIKEPRAAKKKKETAEPIRRFQSKDGFQILCGKSGTGNDLLLKKYARPDDLWFHAKNAPGSHVVLKTKGKGFSREAIEDAAKIAAYYSKLKESGKAEVIYTEARHVKKPKGAKPGMVVVGEYKTIVVKPVIWNG